MDDVSFWIPYGIRDGRVHVLANAAVFSSKKEANEALEANRLHAARAVVWAAPSGGWGSLESAIEYRHPLSRVAIKVPDPPSALQRVLTSFLRSRCRCWGGMGFVGFFIICLNRCWLKLVVHFTVICKKCVKYLVKAPDTAGSFFKFPLHDLIYLGEQRELLAGMDWLHSSIQSSEMHIQLVDHELSAHHSKLKYVQSETRALDASMQG